MHASTRAIASSLADAAQAMGLDAMSALAAELSARMAPVETIAVNLTGSFGTVTGKIAVEPSPELRAEVEPGKIHHVAPGDRLTVKTPVGFPLFTVEVSRKG